MTRVRIGFVGTGSMGQVAHLHNYLRLRDDVDVVALAEPRARLAATVASKAGIDRVYASASEMLASETLDAIVAPQPFTHHLGIVAPLYDAGLPLLTEKPLAISSEIGAAMLRRLDASAVPFHMVAYHKRSDPAVHRAKELIDRLLATGEWGSLNFVRMTMAGTDWSLGAFDDMVASDEPVPAMPADASSPDDYVSFVNFYIHQVNLIRHLLGEDYSVRHAAPSGHLLVGEAVGGATVTLEMAPWGDPEWDESVVVGFEKGSIRIQLPAPLAARQAGRLEIRGDLGDGFQRTTPTLPPVHAMLQQAKNFVAAVRGDAEPPCDAHEAQRDLLLADQYLALQARR